MEINHIYNENCLDTMARMPDGFIDLTVTSPPYNKAGLEGFIRTGHSNGTWQGGRNISYNGDANLDFLSEEDYQASQVAMLAELFRVTKYGGSLFYNHKNRIKDYVTHSPREWLIKTPWKICQEIIWDRGSSPNVAPIRFMPTTERVYWMFKGEKPATFNGHCLSFTEVWRITADSGNDHPAPFPVEIAARCIKACSNEGDLIYDPFMGSGTTAKAAHQLKRRWIGSEISSEYVELANKRLEPYLAQESLF